MPATQFAVVYGTQSKVIRRFIEPGPENLDDGHIAVAQGNLQPGESLLAFPLAQFAVRTRATLQSTIGQPLHSGRCAVVDASVLPNMVRAIVQADPLVDQPAAQQLLVQTDVAQIGWTYAAGIFAAPVAVTVGVTLGATQL